MSGDANGIVASIRCAGTRRELCVSRRQRNMIAHRRVDLPPLITHRFALDNIREAYDLFSEQRGGVLKVALYPEVSRMPAGTRKVEEAAV